MTRGLSLQMVFSLFFVETLFHDDCGSGKPIMADIYQLLKMCITKIDNLLDERTGNMRVITQRLA